MTAGYLFVATQDLDASVESTGKECSVTGGDIIKVTQTPSVGAQTVRMTVVTSKRGDCRANSEIMVSTSDLQDMKNSFAQSVDDGLAKLHDQNGKGGLPSAPADAQAAAQTGVSDQEVAQAKADALAAANTLDSQPVEDTVEQ